MMLLRTGIGALIIALATAGAHAQGVTPNRILVGQSTPLSGANKALGEDIRDGALAYFKKLTEAGGETAARSSW